jgi:hypothetical protein
MARLTSTTCKGIVFERDRLTIHCEPHCDYKNPADLKEQESTVRGEDEWAAMETLGRLVVFRWPVVPPMWADSPVVENWQAYLMYLLKPVCRHYAVNDEVVLTMFMKHYLLSIMISPRHKKPTQEKKDAE